MKLDCIVELEQHLAETYSTDKPSIAIERPPEHFEGDITINCFRLAKGLRNAPPKIAETAATFLKNHSDVVKVDTVKAFVNVTLTGIALFRDTMADKASILPETVIDPETQRRILIEFSAPNTNKPQHLGHVRNNALGQSLASLLQRVGHDVKPVNLVNDRGIHICKSMIAYERWGNETTPEQEGVKGDKLVGDFYVRYDKQLRKQLDDLRQAKPELADRSNDDLFLETELGAATQEMLVKWEENDEALRALWQKMNNWVLEGFARTYERMGVFFDKTYLESETYSHGREVVLDFLKKGYFEKTDNGAVIVDLTDQKLDTKVLLRKDGTSVYATQDIGTTLIKQKDYSPDQQVWVVGDEQIYHFKVLFAIMKRLGYDWAENLYHMPYGMVNLPEGKMKSREGTVVDADDLFDEMERLAREATLGRYEEAPDDLDERARIIGMAALKFMLLKVSPRSSMMFDPNESMRFEGDTGPYVLYAYARINSMFRKIEESEGTFTAEQIDWSVLGSAEERHVALKCAEYPDILKCAAERFDISVLASYLLEMAKAFNQFYRECPVLKAETTSVRDARLAICKCVQDVLHDGLTTLTIETLECM